MRRVWVVAGGPGKSGMARGYRSGDRDLQFLMPPDVREWVPSSHLVWTVLEVVEQVDTSVFHRLSRRGGAGRAGFDPDMLLGVLILGYCTGQRSTRQMERLCSQDVAFRVACANQPPDHTVLARFRQNHEQAFEELFSEVLVMAAVRGLVRLDTVAVDGTKIAANASLDANRSEQWVREQAVKILAEAQTVDAAEDELFGDARGDEPDEAMTDPVAREQAVREWLAELERAKRDRRSRPWGVSNRCCIRTFGSAVSGGGSPVTCRRASSRPLPNAISRSGPGAVRFAVLA